MDGRFEKIENELKEQKQIVDSIKKSNVMVPKKH